MNVTLHQSVTSTPTAPILMAVTPVLVELDTQGMECNALVRYSVIILCALMINCYFQILMSAA